MTRLFRSEINRSGAKTRFKTGIKKMSALRKHLRGWAAHTNGIYKQQKYSLQSTITNLDVTAENRTRSNVERDQLDQARIHLTNLL
jgi:hypothetical protein